MTWYTEQWSNECNFSIKYEKELHSEKSPFQQIDFYQGKEFGTFFTLDRLMMVNEKDEFIYHDMIVHPAFATNPNIKKVLIIGGGDGGTAREVLRYPSVEEVVMVEIDERVFRLCQEYLPVTAKGVEEDKRMELRFEDGLAYVKNAPDASFDLILVDSTDPISVGEGLFTTAFYQECYRVLNKDGILINQHESPYFAEYAENMRKARKKIKAIFPITNVYQYHMPTYPSGHWLFGFASKTFDPVKDIRVEDWKSFGLKTKYYNTDLHVGAFQLPSYVKEALETDE
ncbi:polyamine aminopropyltransferase [Ornithinibacillus sp. BX22]|uniref:Polyamine aminopropyltransferase n=2 Tax=Ornithinibacillus TaxID=484508 RepID=A0A923L541_9BACI|nr:MULTISPECIES: polyamine aminopropyltransferase [Ornithinibacillus]MBC5636596.1 polyamine aminopropyltransferase [Ornithinibacillus hominis]MBS3680562.1 polyamine aminopropyltransferase [Ornithinibacillus massiliensis]